MSSTWYRITNYVDCKLTDAVHKGDGKRWAQTVVPGKTYYTIATVRMPWGNQQVLEEHVFTDRRGLASARIEGAEGLYNNHGGRVYDNRRTGPCNGLMTLAEYAATGSAEELVTGGNLNDYSSQPKRGRRAA